VNVKSTDTDIKKAYLTLVKKYHPDLNKTAGTKEMFSKIVE
jgi:curved DNA-binding protein CbpA